LQEVPFPQLPALGYGHAVVQYWFIAMHLLTATKKSSSAKEMQRQLEHNRYEPIWAMMHKIRSVLGLRDDGHTLTYAIELDEGFFETVVRDRY